MNKLYIFTKIITFPGAIVRCLWEHIVCKIFGIPVEDTRALRNDELSSHIEHELMPTSRGAFSICFVPAFLNGVLALLLSISSVLGLFVFQMSDTLTMIVNIVAYWFAFSLYINSYPTVEDALNMKEKVYGEGTVLQKIIYAPGFAFCYIAAFLEKYCVTFLLAIAIMIFMIIKF